MDVNKENIKRALNETWGQWEWYWKMCDRSLTDEVTYNPRLEFGEGDLIYIQLQVGYPHELAFGHWCYVVKKISKKVFIIPSTSARGKIDEQYEMDIISVANNEPIASRLQFTEARWVDLQRIAPKKGIFKAITPRDEIMKKLHNVIRG